MAPTSEWLFVPGLWEVITPNSDLWLGWCLKQTCSSPQELFNGVSHSTCTDKDRVYSWLLVVGRPIASFTSDSSFDHNLCCKYMNGSCEAIFDIYTSKPFQRYKEHLNARCFDPCNKALSFWESQRTPTSHFLGMWVSSSHLPQSGVATMLMFKSIIHRMIMESCLTQFEILDWFYGLYNEPLWNVEPKHHKSIK
jgi:hypothetical protein